MRSAASLLGVVVVVALAGCGNDDSTATTVPKTTSMDATRGEKAIEVSVAEQSHRIAIVVCPTGIKRQKGKSFNCIATLSQGDKYPFRVTQKDAKGNVHYEQATGATAAARGSATTP
jgi:hypothetical protein